MNNRQPWQLKKSKSWGPFWSYRLDSSANLAHLPQIGPNWQNWQCCLAGISKMALKIFIFSIAMVADYSFYVKSIATFALTFLGILFQS